MSEPRVLDPCCGSRMFWFDKESPDVVFGDCRKESHILCDGRALHIAPNVIMDFTDMPFPDGRFQLVVFDPPHLNRVGPNGWQGKKYGSLPKEWRATLESGLRECFRVLDANGVLIFKWNETQIPILEVLSLTPVVPLFGHTTTRNCKTHWMTFIKPEAPMTQPDVSEELKACPFCGTHASQPENISARGSRRPIWQVSCGWHCVSMQRGTRKELIKDWNRRQS